MLVTIFLTQELFTKGLLYPRHGPLLWWNLQSNGEDRQQQAKEKIYRYKLQQILIGSGLGAVIIGGYETSCSDRVARKGLSQEVLGSNERSKRCSWAWL